jgi:electron transfer flavoprotein alpha subunit
MAQLIEKHKPLFMLYSATRNGVDLAARLAIKFDTNLTAHAIKLDIDKEKNQLITGVPGFGGNIVAVVRGISGKPHMATVSVGAFEKIYDENRTGDIEKVDVVLDESKIRLKVIQEEMREIADISRAEKILVAGMGCQDVYDKVKKLAEKLGLAFGVTRPLADIGLAPRSLQIGSTGVSLKGKLAIILGASGAPHFVSGVREVEKVISVNIDDEAPILDHSDVFILADLEEVVDKIYEEVGE